MAHTWSMHDAHLGYAFFFLDMLAEYTLLSMTVIVTPCLWYVVGMKLVCPMSKIPQAPFARAPFGESRKKQKCSSNALAEHFCIIDIHSSSSLSSSLTFSSLRVFLDTLNFET